MMVAMLTEHQHRLLVKTISGDTSNSDETTRLLLRLVDEYRAEIASDRQCVAVALRALARFGTELPCGYSIERTRAGVRFMDTTIPAIEAVALACALLDAAAQDVP